MRFIVRIPPIAASVSTVGAAESAHRFSTTESQTTVARVPPSGYNGGASKPFPNMLTNDVNTSKLPSASSATPLVALTSMW